jgi:ubiquinone/menaquinone biosynthesis C-methylase UbiE
MAFYAIIRAKINMEKTQITDSWLAAQALKNAQQWDESLTTYYPEASEWMNDSASYLNQLTKKCNYLNAAKLIDWDSVLPDNATVVDIGCGGGWLTAFLSKQNKVKKIIAIDSSINYLTKFLPEVVELSAGNKDKINTIQGLFSPILSPSDSIDVVVMSSAIHHAESLEGVLQEIRRVLKINGILVILNECPVNNFHFIAKTIRVFLRMLLSNLQRKYNRHSQRLFVGGVLYDPYLGDIDYPKWYWQKAIDSSQLTVVKTIDTMLPTVVGSKGRSLIHFICRKTV